MLELLAVVHPKRSVTLGEVLAVEEAKLARNTVLILITASTNLDWPTVLHLLQRRGVRPLAILLNPHSFDESFSSNARVQDALLAEGVSAIPIDRGDPLVHVLEQGPR